MRMGLYALYRGKTYRAARLNLETYKLITDEAAAGFVQSEFTPESYIKVVQRSDLQELYMVKTYANYAGEQLEVVEDEPDAVTLASADAQLAERYGMDKLDRCDYRLKVSKSNITLFTERIEQLC